MQDPSQYTYFLVGRALFGMGYIGQLIWFSTVASQWFYYNEIGVAMSLLLAFSYFGQLVADIITPIEYRRARLLSQPLWLAVYLYTAAFILVIIFNKLESYTSKKYFKFITMRSEKVTPSVTLKSDKTTPN